MRDLVSNIAGLRARIAKIKLSLAVGESEDEPTKIKKRAPSWTTLKWQPVQDLKEMLGKRYPAFIEDVGYQLGATSEELLYVLGSSAQIRNNTWIKEGILEYLEPLKTRLPIRNLNSYKFTLYGTKTPMRKLAVVGVKSGGSKNLVIVDESRRLKIQGLLDSKYNEGVE